MKGFPPFRPLARQNHASAERILLTPEAFAVLRYLVEHPGRLVGTPSYLTLSGQRLTSDQKPHL